MKYKALVIGCGNIGASYDLNTSGILTHAKALSNKNLFELSFFDIDQNLSQKIASTYNGFALNDLNVSHLGHFDLVSICSPTAFHTTHLSIFLQLNTKVIICEKPVSLKSDELEIILNLKKQSASHVLVNYIRRFQPAYIHLKSTYKTYFSLDDLKRVAIKYKRGFLNNASHAFDLLEFLFDTPIHLEEVNIISSSVDAFADDPTRTLTARWNQAVVDVEGVPGIDPIWECDLFFKNFRLRFVNSGNDISILSAEGKVLFQLNDGIKNYMSPVIDVAVKLLTSAEPAMTNFESSLSLNKKMIQYIQ